MPLLVHSPATEDGGAQQPNVKANQVEGVVRKEERTERKELVGGMRGTRIRGNERRARVVERDRRRVRPALLANPRCARYPTPNRLSPSTPSTRRSAELAARRRSLPLTKSWSSAVEAASARTAVPILPMSTASDSLSDLASAVPKTVPRRLRMWTGQN